MSQKEQLQEMLEHARIEFVKVGPPSQVDEQIIVVDGYYSVLFTFDASGNLTRLDAHD